MAATTRMATATPRTTEVTGAALGTSLRLAAPLARRLPVRRVARPERQQRGDPGIPRSARQGGGEAGVPRGGGQEGEGRPHPRGGQPPGRADGAERAVLRDAPPWLPHRDRG